MIRRNIHLVRLMTYIFDKSYINAEERELLRNIRVLREHVRTIIHKRRQDIANGFQQNGDFLTILIEDELFSKDEEKMLDECFLFLVAST